ncbi:MAG: HAD family hydrolase [Bdellovibrionaceae bacterium]|nr:HAD family hydrolase [Pseudobdellovibrionaceae bacterium]
MYKNLTELVSHLSEKTLFILDIDSSLVLTHPRNETILRLFAQSIKATRPDLSLLLAQAKCHPFEYGYFAALERYAPGLDESTTEDIRQYWKTHFFSNQFLHCDLPHEGAIEFVNLLKQKNFPFVYLTGRPSNLMRPGTLQTLQDFGFPVSDEILHMKPSETYVDESFKADILNQLIAGYDNVIFIDNEPRVLNLVTQLHPQVNLVFVDTCHSPNVTAPASAVKIKNFSEFNSLLRSVIS